jgi:hypothetical protein
MPRDCVCPWINQRVAGLGAVTPTNFSAGALSSTQRQGSASAHQWDAQITGAKRGRHYPPVALGIIGPECGSDISAASKLPPLTHMQRRNARLPVGKAGLSQESLGQGDAAVAAPHEGAPATG